MRDLPTPSIPPKRLEKVPKAEWRGEMERKGDEKNTEISGDLER